MTTINAAGRRLRGVRSEQSRQLLAALAGPATLPQLAAELGWSRGVAWDRLRGLTQCGLARRVRRGALEAAD